MLVRRRNASHTLATRLSGIVRATGTLDKAVARCNGPLGWVRRAGVGVVAPLAAVVVVVVGVTGAANRARLLLFRKTRLRNADVALVARSG